MTLPVLEVKDLSYSYPDGRAALRGVSFSVEPGERVAILGSNGAGKTTLLLHLIGLLEPVDGEVRIGGVLLTLETVRELRAKIGFVFQDPDDQLFMTTLRQDVAFGPANYGVVGSALDARVTAALGSVGLAGFAERAPHHLSVGERRRAALATVLAMEPEVLVLDEPSAGLDPEGRDRLSSMLGGMDRTILMVTHDLPYALEVCDRALIMNAGWLVADGPIDRILADCALLAANLLSLPKGFDPELARRVEGAAE